MSFSSGGGGMQGTAETLAYMIKAYDMATPVFRAFGKEVETVTAHVQRSMEQMNRAMVASDRAAVAGSDAQIAALHRTEAAQKHAATSSAKTAESESAASKRAAAAASQEAAAAEVAAKRKVAAATSSEAAFGRSSSALSRYGKIAIEAAAGAAGLSIDMAAKFQANTLRMETQAGATAKGLDQIRAGLLKMAPEVGATPDQLANGMYHVVSAMNAVLPPSTRVSQELAIMKIAAEGAQVGHANLEETTYALSSALNALHWGANRAGQVMGILNATVGAGDMTMQDLVDAMKSGIIPAAQTFGISLQSVNAALAVMGDMGMRGAISGTRLRMAISLLAAPTHQAAKILETLGLNSHQALAASDAMSKALAKAGISTSQLSDDLRKPDGLKVALQDLHAHMIKNGLTADAMGSAIDRAYGGGRMGATIKLLLENTDRLGIKYDQIGQKASQFGHDWQLTQHTFRLEVDKAVAALEAFGIAMGEKLIPVATVALHALEGTAHWFMRNTWAVETLGAAVGTFATVAIGSYLFSKLKAVIGLMKEFGGAMAGVGRWMMGGAFGGGGGATDPAGRMKGGLSEGGTLAAEKMKVALNSAFSEGGTLAAEKIRAALAESSVVAEKISAAFSEGGTLAAEKIRAALGGASVAGPSKPGSGSGNLFGLYGYMGSTIRIGTMMNPLAVVLSNISKSGAGAAAAEASSGQSIGAQSAAMQAEQKRSVQSAEKQSEKMTQQMSLLTESQLAMQAKEAKLGEQLSLGGIATGPEKQLQNMAAAESKSMQEMTAMQASMTKFTSGAGGLLDLFKGGGIKGALSAEGGGLGSLLKGGGGALLRGAGVGGAGLLASQLLESVIGGQTGKDVGKIGNFASIGAGIGTAIEPGIGTAIGAGIMGGLGTLITLLGHKDYGKQLADAIFSHGFGGEAAKQLSTSTANALNDAQKIAAKHDPQSLGMGGPGAGPAKGPSQADKERLAHDYQLVGNNIAGALEKGWSQFKFQSEPTMITQLKAKLKGVPPQAQAYAVESAISFAQGLEKQGKLSPQQFQKMLDDIKKQFPGFWQYLGLTANAGIGQFNKALKLDQAQQTLKTAMNNMRGDFPTVTAAMDKTAGTVTDKAGAMARALGQIIHGPNSTPAMRAAAQHDLDLLRQNTQQNFTAMADLVAEKQHDMTAAIQAGSGTAYKTATTNLANLVKTNKQQLDQGLTDHKTFQSNLQSVWQQGTQLIHDRNLSTYNDMFNKIWEKLHHGVINQGQFNSEVAKLNAGWVANAAQSGSEFAGQLYQAATAGGKTTLSGAVAIAQELNQLLGPLKATKLPIPTAVAVEAFGSRASQVVGHTINAYSPGSGFIHAKGGRVPGAVGPDNWTLVDPSGQPRAMVGGGELLIANRHTEADISRATMAVYNKTAGEMVNGEQRVHSGSYATGGVLDRFATGGAGVAQAGTTAGGSTFSGYSLPLPRSQMMPGSWTFDQGVDIPAPAHTPEFAIGPGVVTGEGITGFGPNTPILRVDQGPLAGTSFYYGHAGPDRVPVGAHVSAGQQISEVGEGIVGISTGPHIEFGIWPPVGGARVAELLKQLMSGAGVTGVGGGGGGGASWTDIKAPKVQGTGLYTQLVQAGLNTLTKAGNAFGQKLASQSSGMSGSTAGLSGSEMQIVQQLAKRFGWESQVGDWEYVLNRESNGSLTDTNPQSGAYGLAQFIQGPSQYYQYGGNPNTYEGQLLAMANYIKERYGNPAAAAAHERSFNWYERGGRVPAYAGRFGNGGMVTANEPTVAMFGDKGPETAMFLPHAARGLTAYPTSTSTSSSSTQTSGGTSTTTTVTNSTSATGVSSTHVSTSSHPVKPPTTHYRWDFNPFDNEVEYLSTADWQKIAAEEKKNKTDAAAVKKAYQAWLKQTSKERLAAGKYFAGAFDISNADLQKLGLSKGTVQLTSNLAGLSDAAFKKIEEQLKAYLKLSTTTFTQQTNIATALSTKGPNASLNALLAEMDKDRQEEKKARGKHREKIKKELEDDAKEAQKMMPAVNRERQLANDAITSALASIKTDFQNAQSQFQKDIKIAQLVAGMSPAGLTAVGLTSAQKKASGITAAMLAGNASPADAFAQQADYLVKTELPRYQAEAKQTSALYKDALKTHNTKLQQQLLTQLDSITQAELQAQADYETATISKIKAHSDVFAQQAQTQASAAGVVASLGQLGPGAMSPGLLASVASSIGLGGVDLGSLVGNMAAATTEQTTLLQGQQQTLAQQLNYWQSVLPSLSGTSRTDALNTMAQLSTDIVGLDTTIQQNTQQLIQQTASQYTNTATHIGSVVSLITALGQLPSNSPVLSQLGGKDGYLSGLGMDPWTQMSLGNQPAALGLANQAIGGQISQDQSALAYYQSVLPTLSGQNLTSAQQSIDQLASEIVSLDNTIAQNNKQIIQLNANLYGGTQAKGIAGAAGLLGAISNLQPGADISAIDGIRIALGLPGLAGGLGIDSLSAYEGTGTTYFQTLMSKQNNTLSAAQLQTAQATVDQQNSLIQQQIDSLDRELNYYNSVLPSLTGTDYTDMIDTMQQLAQQILGLNSSIDQNNQSIKDLTNATNNNTRVLTGSVAYTYQGQSFVGDLGTGTNSLSAESIANLPVGS